MKLASFDLKLPLPPSVNRAFRNVPRVGRVKTKDYRLWRADAVKLIWAQVPADRRISGNVAVRIVLPRKMRGDIDNRIKGILDALVESRRIDDDSHVTTLTISKSGGLPEALVWVGADLTDGEPVYGRGRMHLGMEGGR